MNTSLATNTISSHHARCLIAQVPQEDWRQDLPGHLHLVTFSAQNGTANINVTFNENSNLLSSKPSISISNGGRNCQIQKDLLLEAEVLKVATQLQNDRKLLKTEVQELLANPEKMLEQSEMLSIRKISLANHGTKFRLTLPCDDFGKLGNLKFCVDISHNIGDRSPHRGSIKPEGHSLDVSATCLQHRITTHRIPSSGNSRLKKLFEAIKDLYINPGK